MRKIPTWVLVFFIGAIGLMIGVAVVFGSAYIPAALFPMPTPTTTPEPLPTIDPEVEAVFSYIEAVNRELGLANDAMSLGTDYLNLLPNNPALIEDPDWLEGHTDAMIKVWEHHTNITNLEAPPMFADIHDEIAEASAICANAAIAGRDAFIRNNADMMDAAADESQACADASALVALRVDSLLLELESMPIP